MVGTLLGSTVTYVFQRVNAGRVERFAHDERLRQERMAAYSGFAGAITELRRGVISLWFVRQRDDAARPELYAARTESDRLGAAADHARFGCNCLPKTLISWRWPMPRSNRSVRYTIPQIGLSWWSTRTGARTC